MSDYHKLYVSRYTGEQVDELLARIPSVEQRVSILEAGGGGGGGGGGIDPSILREYVTREELNGRNYITQSALSTYITQSELEPYAKTSYVNSEVKKVDDKLGSYYTKSEIDAMNLATHDWVYGLGHVLKDDAGHSLSIVNDQVQLNNVNGNKLNAVTVSYATRANNSEHFASKLPKDFMTTRGQTTDNDLDTLLTSGVYRLGNNVTNQPVNENQAAYSQLLVLRGDGNNDTTTQMLFPYSVTRMWIRSASDSMRQSADGWRGLWKRVMLYGDTAAFADHATTAEKADKLKSSVSLWGNTFDGSQSIGVSGAYATLDHVNNINMHGILTLDNSKNIKFLTATGKEALNAFDSTYSNNRLSLNIGYNCAALNGITYINGGDVYLRYGASRSNGIVLRDGSANELQGLVGINNSSPAYELHVSGPGNSGGRIRCSQIGVGVDPQLGFVGAFGGNVHMTGWSSIGGSYIKMYRNDNSIMFHNSGAAFYLMKAGNNSYDNNSFTADRPFVWDYLANNISIGDAAHPTDLYTFGDLIATKNVYIGGKDGVQLRYANGALEVSKTIYSLQGSSALGAGSSSFTDLQFNNLVKMSSGAAIDGKLTMSVGDAKGIFFGSGTDTGIFATNPSSSSEVLNIVANTLVLGSAKTYTNTYCMSPVTTYNGLQVGSDGTRISKITVVNEGSAYYLKITTSYGEKKVQLT